jgi:hypothetical protein
MAVDSRNKRASASGMPWMPIAPTPDGTIGAADRAQISGYYAGISLGSGPAGRGLNMGLLLKVYRS